MTEYLYLFYFIFLLLLIIIFINPKAALNFKLIEIGITSQLNLNDTKLIKWS